MTKFKVGDKVKNVSPTGEEVVIQNGRGHKWNNTRNGKIGIVTRLDCVACNGYTNCIEVTYSNGEIGVGLDYHYKLVSTKMSSPTHRFKSLFIGEPLKSFIKAGIKTEDNMLTEEGERIALNWLLSTKATEDLFNTEVVQPILAAEKEEKKA